MKKQITTTITFNILIYPIIDYPNQKYNVITHSFANYGICIDYLKKMKATNNFHNINMIEIQEEQTIITINKRNQKQTEIHKTICNRLLCYPHPWEYLTDYKCCGNYIDKFNI